ncbi:MAG: hypothetical protein CSA72_14080 [Rhodobacterales bacterium]|nr:MAG: hypothetical protein CSA72_14080 [Rhodobacterales bacterium]
MRGQTMKETIRRNLPFAAILLCAGLGFVFLRDVLSFQALAARREDILAFRDAHYALTALGFIAIYTAIVALSLPGAAIASIAGGMLFGLFPGTPFNLIAATLGAVLIFLAARSGFGARLSAKIDATDGKVARLKSGIEDNQWSVLFIMRLVPVVPFFVANVIPALLNVPLRRFVITTALGIIPGAFVYTSVGAGIGEVIAAGEEPNLGVIFEPHILLPILGLAALAALPMVLKAIKGVRGAR